MKPPIEKDVTIVVRDALYFVADIIHPSEGYRNKSKCDVRKSVLSAIRTAYEQHVFGQGTYNLTDKVDARDFFTWARGQKFWQALKAVEGLPCYIHVEVNMVSPSFARVHGLAAPATYAELWELYTECTKKLVEREKYIEGIQRELEELV
jgi:hypothetical protein